MSERYVSYTGPEFDEMLREFLAPDHLELGTCISGVDGLCVGVRLPAAD